MNFSFYKNTTWKNNSDERARCVLWILRSSLIHMGRSQTPQALPTHWPLGTAWALGGSGSTALAWPLVTRAGGGNIPGWGHCWPFCAGKTCTLHSSPSGLSGNTQLRSALLIPTHSAPAVGIPPPDPWSSPVSSFLDKNIHEAAFTITWVSSVVLTTERVGG